ncbi:unnamed protein product [Gadus morhua 'NCC']
MTDHLKPVGLGDLNEEKEEEESKAEEEVSLTRRCEVMQVPEFQVPSHLSVSHMESEFLQLTIRKQVSYR